MADTKVDKTLNGRAGGGVYKRPNFSTEFKRQLVEQSLESGASVALIARSNDINANLLFKWRRQYLEGKYGPLTLPEGAARGAERELAPLLPVNIIAETPAQASPASANAVAPLENVCEVQFERACLRIRGDVSPDTLRLLVRELSR